MSEKYPLLNPTRYGFAGVIAGDRGEWKELTGVEEFIDNLATGDIDTEIEDDEIHRVISGIPSPWARAVIFRYALNHDPTNNARPSGLARYFQSLQDEWKGLMACIALNHDKIRTEKIFLEYSDVDDADFSFYEVRGAMGALLLEDRYYWTNPVIKGEHTPFLQAIFFESKFDEENPQILIGATSPFTLFFTPPKIEGDVQFFDKHRGRFTSPLSTELTEKQLQSIYDYARYISDHLEQFQKQFKHDDYGDLDLGLIAGFLERFQREIKEYVGKMRQKGNRKFKLKEKGLFSTNTDFQAPFDIILNAEAKVYQDERGQFWIDSAEGRKEVIINDLMMNPDNELIQVGFTEYESPERCAAHLLQAEEFYYALPLSKIGLKTFQKDLSKMLLGEQDEHSSLFARLTDRGKTEIVATLQLKVYIDEKGIESELYPTPKTYKTRLINDDRIIVWPDFVSREGLWKDYYLYSELPHDTTGEVRAFPFLLDVEGGVIRENEAGEFEYAFPTKKDDLNAPKQQNHEVIIPQPRESSEAVSYEIYRSDSPFIGVEFRLGASDNPNLGGFLVGKFDDKNDFAFHNHDISPPLRPATIGFDFGSNNTCIGVAREGYEPQLVEFHNRRRVLLGSDIHDEDKKLDAKPHELFFFQKEFVAGKMRSMMKVHHDSRLNDPKLDVRKVVLGGFTIFEKNVPVLRPAVNSKYEFEIDLKGGLSKIKYNMKWAGISQVKENGYKYGFIQVLWLMINAELFWQSYYPEKLAWAYPAAFTSSLRANYRSMWEEIIPVIEPTQEYGGNSIVNIHSKTETEAVANFASNSRLAGLSPGTGEITIGFDVGGSTTDILLLVNRRGKNHLIRQSSVLIAADPLSRAMKTSQYIRDALQDFVLVDRGINVFGITRDRNNRLDEQTGAYFANTVFDRLNEEQMKRLYLKFFSTEDRRLFTITSYLSGILLYYSGQLMAEVLQGTEFDNLRRARLAFFGKGGNIFNWIMTVNNGSGAAEEFYRACFIGGLFGPDDAGKTKEDIKFPKNSAANSSVKSTVKQSDIAVVSDYKTNFESNKTEVAFGLAQESSIDQPDANGSSVDIIGEQGYTYQGKKMDWNSHVHSDQLKGLDDTFMIPATFPRLEHFIDILYDFVVKFDSRSADMIRNAVSYDMGPFRDFIKKEVDPYKEAARHEASFDFKASLFVLEGMYILEKVIMAKCMK
ncbi:MAG: hypothetical protein AAGN35_03940 [Bacteroidota bacterium]